MARTGVPIPTLDPPWPEGQEIAVVIAQAASPGWRRLTHDAAAAAQPGGHSFPLDEAPRSRDSTADDDLTAFLYRHEDRVGGYLCLASRLITGFRSPTTGYRPTLDTARIIWPSILIVWVDTELRRQGIARRLVVAAAQHADVVPSSMGWAEPFTDNGYLLAQSIAPGGLWITDYS
jgi:GNAT superfamily N-acetyltransferase